MHGPALFQGTHSLWLNSLQFPFVRVWTVSTCRARALFAFKGTDPPTDQYSNGISVFEVCRDSIITSFAMVATLAPEPMERAPYLNTVHILDCWAWSFHFNIRNGHIIPMA